MTVHMFRVQVGIGNQSVSQLEQRFNAWMRANERWEGDTVPHELRQTNTREDGSGTEFYAIDVRFLPASGRANIQQALESRLGGGVAWYRIGYHACTHREGDGSSGPCSWDSVTEWSADGESVPADVPSIETG